MSAQEHFEGREPPVESRSSITLTRNAKGETQIVVKVYTGDTAEEIADAKQRAIDTYNAVTEHYYGTRSAA